MFYLTALQLCLLLAAVPTVRLQLGQAELPQQVAGAAQEVAGEAQLPAGLGRQLGPVRRQLGRQKEKQKTVTLKHL